MGHYYGVEGRILSGIVVVVVSIGFLSVQISVIGYLLSNSLKMGYFNSVLLSYLILILYSSFGGLKSVILNNLLQFITIIIAIPTMTYFAINHIGINDFINNIPTNKYSFYDNKMLWDTIFITMNFSVLMFYPPLIQRAALNRDSKYILNGMVIKTIIYMIFVVFIGLNALLILQISPNSLPSHAIQDTLAKIMPAGLFGFVIIGFISAAMSTADTDLNIASLALSQDIAKNIWHIRNDKKMLYIVRITTILIGLLGVVLATLFDHILDVVLYVAGIWSPTILVPFLFLMLGMVNTKTNMLLGVLLGISSYILWIIFANHLMIKGVFIGTIVHTIFFLLSYYWLKRS
jgi:Na+/proline symporter